jgi:hypothetical protein
MVIASRNRRNAGRDDSSSATIFRSMSSDMRRIRAVRPARSRAAAKNQLQRSRLERGDCSQRLYDLEIFLDERRTGRSEIRRDFQLKRYAAP